MPNLIPPQLDNLVKNKGVMDTSQPMNFNPPTSPKIGQALNDMKNIGMDIANLGPVQRGATGIAKSVGVPQKWANLIGVGATMAVPLGDLEAGTRLMPIERLVAHEGTDAARVGEYVNMLKNGEKITPLKVIPEGSMKFGIEDGKHRLEALKQLGATHAPVEVLPSKVHVNYYDQQRFLKDKSGKFSGSMKGK